MNGTHITPKSGTIGAFMAKFAINPSTDRVNTRTKGVYAALVSAFFMGMAPIFGKQAILFGLSPLAVVAVRTLLAACLLLLLMLLFYRQFLYIYPAGLLGCLLAGWTNGLGSLFYYSALGRIDAGLGHLLYSLYPFFLIFWLALDHQAPSRLTLLRLCIALPAVLLLSQTAQGTIDFVGVVEMLIAAALYALHLPINQRVLYEMPAPTVTVYTLLAMSAIVVPTFAFSGSWTFEFDIHIWWPLIGLTLVTFFSRLMLFLGVKHLGGMQTALLGLSELLVAVIVAQIWLGERFSILQWIGAALLIISLLMVCFEKPHPKTTSTGGWLKWLSPPTLPNDIPWQPHD
jgi:drug/metabolite transporter (DMT)-like permease